MRDIMRVYRIYDTKNEEYVAGAQRTVFESATGAKVSARTEFTRWNKYSKDWPVQKKNRSYVSFKDQERFVIHTFSLQLEKTV